MQLMTKFVLSTVRAALLVLAAASASAQPLYHLVDLGQAQVYDFNNSGEAVGNPHDGQHGALWYDGAWHSFKHNLRADLAGVDDNRTIVGTRKPAVLGRNPAAAAWTADGQRFDLVPEAVESYGTFLRRDGSAYGVMRPHGKHPVPFMWHDGSLEAYPYAKGSRWTRPTGANKSNQISANGVSTMGGDSCPKPLLFTSGAWVRLDAAPYGCGSAAAVNDSGVVVGSVGTHAVTWKDGVRTQLPGLGGSFDSAFDINAAGVIVGQSAYNDAGHTHAVMWRDGVLTMLDTVIDTQPTQGYLGYAIAINDAGQILVSGRENNSNTSHAWRLDPL